MFRKVRQGAVHIISGSVPLNAENAEGLTSAVEDCCSEGAPLIVLDLAEVPLMDSAGLELLLTIQERAEANSGMVKLAAPNPLCRDILNATGLINLFEIHREAKAAVGSFLH